MRGARTILLSSALILVAAILTWIITGAEGYTRWPNEKLEQSSAPISAAEDDLLSEIGFETNEERETQPTIESRFALGLVPGGIDPAHLVSVATVAAITIAAAAGTYLLRRAQPDTLTEPST